MNSKYTKNLHPLSITEATIHEKKNNNNNKTDPGKPDEITLRNKRNPDEDTNGIQNPNDPKC